MDVRDEILHLIDYIFVKEANIRDRVRELIGSILRGRLGDDPYIRARMSRIEFILGRIGAEGELSTIDKMHLLFLLYDVLNYLESSETGIEEKC